MYNRYVPLSDGSYQKNRIADKRSNPPAQRQDHPSQNRSSQLPPPAATENISKVPTPTESKGFIRQLLPKNFDTGDLLIVLLLLLIGGDCEEEKSNALLTLALYFFM